MRVSTRTQVPPDGSRQTCSRPAFCAPLASGRRDDPCAGQWVRRWSFFVLIALGLGVGPAGPASVEPGAAEVEGDGVLLPRPPAETRALYERWAKVTNTGAQRRQHLHPLYKELLAAPDADLCFLEGSKGNGDYVTHDSREALGQLNTPRTFAVVVRGLEHPDVFRRDWATSTLRHFPPEQSGDLLAARLVQDPKRQVRWSAVQALAQNAAAARVRPKVRAALRVSMDDPDLDMALFAAAGLGSLGEAEALAFVERRLGEARADHTHHEHAIHAIRVHRRKRAVEVMLREFGLLWEKDPAREGFLVGLAATVLLEYYDAPVDRFRPTPDPPPYPETPAQWEEWWARTGPTLNGDLTPRVNPPDVTKIGPQDVHDDPTKILLVAVVDAPVYRLGDPIRLTLRMSNTSDRPCRVYLPFVPSSWSGTMAYGVRLTRGGGKPVVDLAPSNKSSLISYGGPPDWQVLLPAESFEDETCLQSWIENLLDLPLPAGEYELHVTFDPADFDGIARSPGGILHRWQAPPVKFRVEGRPREDPTELLEVIGAKARLAWLREDLVGERSDRRKVVWRAIHEYGDSRLRAYLEQFEKDNPEKGYAYLNPEHLRPFNRHRP